MSMDVGLTRMSTKGQIVIPNDLRSDFDVGEKLFVIKDDNKLIIKKASRLNENLANDLAFSKRTEEAMKRIEKGEGIEMEFDNLIEEMKKW